ncbi:MAG TPA: hypothetical protein VGG33_11195 [Polyangia bacterium]
MSAPEQSAHPPRQTDSEPRIAVLVLGCLLTTYDRCIKTIRATWASKSLPNVDVLYLYGGQGTNAGQDAVDIETIIGRPRPQLADGEVWASDDIILTGSEDVQHFQRNCILRKRLYAFGYLAHERQYDFIYTVCASSYVDLAALQRYVYTLDPHGIYQGPLNVDGRSGYPFVSGASMLLSRDIAAALADHAEDILPAYPDQMPDDVVIGHWVATNYGGRPLTEIRSRIATSQKPTDNQTFVEPDGGGMVDFVFAPAFRQVPKERAFHYHFHSQRLWDMENFHRRFFTDDAASDFPHEPR